MKEEKNIVVEQYKKPMVLFNSKGGTVPPLLDNSRYAAIWFELPTTTQKKCKLPSALYRLDCSNGQTIGLLIVLEIYNRVGRDYLCVL